MYKSSIEKIIEIYKRSELSISKFASIIGKDRRTVTSWIDKTVIKNPSEEVLKKISTFFRYPDSIWEDDCQNDDFMALLTQIPKEEIKIIDEGYLGGLKYILEHEDKERFVIHPQFPGPMYRDTTVPRVYRTKSSLEIEGFKKQRISKMLSYSFETTEWYSIKSLLNFCFSPIGNFYTKVQKIQILDLIYDNFHENYNKRLYFFDSFSRKIYGLDTAYTSINIKNGVMFFKAPLESVFIEVRNKKLIERIHRHFTFGSEAPTHVNPNDATYILKILKNCVELELGLSGAYEELNRKTFYGELFKNNISVSLQEKLSHPRDGQKTN
ncbi:helix-turn-helix domain-containing protein [Sulfurospirillum arcachonense]|uniref:helix-turn-helix domain-containing protein n=1 Tax=Sulfurospirillum arcachonense TaxID=57666 RepID=UPI000469ABFB|nr:helix-turn-helix transcriptional regulator [Sulfurospirillum arcachonense]